MPVAYIPYKFSTPESPTGSIIVVAESAPINEILFLSITTVSAYVPAASIMVSPSVADDIAFAIVTKGVITEVPELLSLPFVATYQIVGGLILKFAVIVTFVSIILYV